MDRALLVAGAALFLIGLLQGGAVDLFVNPRMALSAHLTAVQSGTAIMVAGAIFPAIALRPALLAVTRWTIVVGMVGLWAALTLAAATGASEALPMAGAGHAAAPGMEWLVTAMVMAASATMIAGWALLLIGLVRQRAD